MVNVIFCAAAILLQQPAPRPVSTTSSIRAATPRFDFRSSFWPNLHHFLYVLGRSRGEFSDRTRTAVASAPLDTMGFARLSSAEKKTWNDVVLYYEKKISPKDIAFSDLIDINYILASAGRTLPDSLPVELRSALNRAAPIYRKLWWSRHDAANRTWIKQVNKLVAERGSRMASDMARAYNSAWPAAPQHVEVVAYANWAGAYTTLGPTLIHVSSTYRDHAGVTGMEQIFHEVTHTMDTAVVRGLTRRMTDASEARLRAHYVLFYTTGWALQRAFGDSTVTYGFKSGLWSRAGGDWPARLDSEWLPWLNRQITMDSALILISHN